MMQSNMYTSLFLLGFIFSISYAAPISSNRNPTVAVNCSEVGDCVTNTDCKEKCGCDRAYYYNETTKECEVNFTYLMQAIVEKYNTQDHDLYTEDSMAKRIRKEADQVFRGIIISVILFMSCASFCGLTACIYCCRINYTDRRLKKDVKALAKKLNRNNKLKKCNNKQPLTSAEQSCNIIVEEAGVFVV